MKKISAISLIFVLILSMGVFSFIDKNTYLVSTEKVEFDKDRDELYALGEKIAGTYNIVVQSRKGLEGFEQYNDAKYLTPEDLQFSDMYKLYTNADEILLKNLTGNDALDALAEIEYVWVFPIPVGDGVLSVVMRRGRPLTPTDERAYALNNCGEKLLDAEQIEEIEEIIANVGRWTIMTTANGFIDKNVIAVDSLNDFLRAHPEIASIDGNVHFIDIPTLQTIAALVVADDGNNYLYLVEENAIYGFRRYGTIGDAGKQFGEIVNQSELLEAFNAWYRE